MFTHLKITHKTGESKLININDYSIGDLDVIAKFYQNCKGYNIESVLI